MLWNRNFGSEPEPSECFDSAPGQTGIPCIELKLPTEGLVKKLMRNKVYKEQSPFFPT